MKLKFNKITLIIYTSILITLLLILLSTNSILPLKDLKDNVRYFFSASAQSFAALVAVILVIYNIISTRIPDYEPVFKKLYQRAFKKYNELKKVRELILLASFVIFIFLISLLFIVKNLYILFLVIFIDIIILFYTLNKFINFTSDSLLRADKDKFFNGLADLIIHNFSHRELFGIFEDIKIFRNQPKKRGFKEIYLDEYRISGLLRPILYAFGKYLLDKKRMGEQLYYANFEKLLDYILKESNKEIIWQSVYYKISPYFKDHINMCVADGHCQKYIPDVISLITKMLDGFIKAYNGHMRDEYFNVFREIIIQIKGIDHFEWYKNRGLDKISESIGIGGLFEFPEFLNLLNTMGISNKEKIKWLNNIKEVNKLHYDRAKDDEEYQNLLKHNGVILFGLNQLEDRKFNLKTLNDEILKLK